MCKDNGSNVVTVWVDIPTDIVLALLFFKVSTHNRKDLLLAIENGLCCGSGGPFV